MIPLRHLRHARYFSTNGRGLSLLFSTACLPHPEKVARGGEDAFFASPDIQAFGIADGVGGWGSVPGVDPGEFSRQLLSHALKNLETKDRSPRTGGKKGDEHLYDALQAACASLRKNRVGGGTTCVLGALDDATALLHLFILGDSGVLVLRPGQRRVGAKLVLHPRVVFRSVEQTHYFNCPFQLSSEDAYPNTVLDNADRIQVRLKENDMLIAATDGLFDNIFDTQIQNMVSAFFINHDGKADPHPLLQELGERMVRLARKVGENEESGVTPFSLNARQDGLEADGGKLDDATVVLGLVVRSPHGQKKLLSNFDYTPKSSGPPR
eukprot:GEMP01048193.1.p1 GENE.GEMP01048193.1~~GEMP01048193.1.p1  ORF type:complete len:332 (+),score=67.91 GEMP01048193.1:27-998(+)